MILHHASSSLCPFQFIEVKYHLAAIQHLLVMTASFTNLLVNSVLMSQYMSRLLVLWQRISLPPLIILQTIRGVVNIMKNALHVVIYLLFTRL